MSTLKQEIDSKLNVAMKEKNSELVNVLRSVKAKISETEKSKDNLNKELDDEGVIKVIIKLAKQREESIILFKKGNREDLASIEQSQLDILNEYLPKKMTDEETKIAVEEAIASGAKDIGSLMKILSKYGTLIDKKLAGEIARKILA